MSAFQPYAGAYEFDGGAYGWRCYATARVYEIRSGAHAPFPRPPQGRKWVAAPRKTYEPDAVCLVDEAVEEFSQILLQVQPDLQPAVRAAQRRAEVASATA
jgi:hypothetical protein